jgi:arginine exporter protein ArgO
MQQPTSRGSPRETMLAVALTLLAVGGFLFFLTLISGGWVIYFLEVVLALIAFAGLHYLLWGRMMMDETAGEREEAELQAKAELSEWDLPEAQRPPHS